VKQRGVGGRSLTNTEHALVMVKRPNDRKLPDEIELAIGMPCMVTWNVKMESNLANGMRRKLVDVIFDGREQIPNDNATLIHLQYHPWYILFQPDETHAASLPGLPYSVFPIEPLERTFTIDGWEQDKKTHTTVTCSQLPLTPSYAFTNYHAQSQTIPATIVDLMNLPTGKRVSPFSMYVCCSRS
jgi:hypothetical protein